MGTLPKYLNKKRSPRNEVIFSPQSLWTVLYSPTDKKQSVIYRLSRVSLFGL